MEVITYKALTFHVTECPLGGRLAWCDEFPEVPCVHGPCNDTAIHECYWDLAYRGLINTVYQDQLSTDLATLVRNTFPGLTDNSIQTVISGTARCTVESIGGISVPVDFSLCTDLTTRPEGWLEQLDYKCLLLHFAFIDRACDDGLFDNPSKNP
jgi:hypothetical protein